MKRRPLALSEAAVADVLEQADWYESQSNSKLSTRWNAAISSTLLRIAENPASGTLCQFTVTELSNVRRMPVGDFPRHIVFYSVSGNQVLILRVIHGARDLDALFR